jgi:hypothetical protein
LFVALGFLLLSTIHFPTSIVWVLRGAAFVAIGVSFVVIGRAFRAFWQHARAYRRENAGD